LPRAWLSPPPGPESPTRVDDSGTAAVGLAEAVGELRRYLLDMLRRGEVEGCEQLLMAMDDIYSLLVTLDYPDALTGGLRRTTDSVRGIIEKTRGALTTALRQDELRGAIEAALQRLNEESATDDG